jgi:hypothetical protein
VVLRAKEDSVMSPSNDADPTQNAADAELSERSDDLKTPASVDAESPEDDDLDDLEFLLEEIENRIAPLA